MAITGALLHDIGKLDAYTAARCAIDLTDLGKLHGEIALGYFRIRREIEEIPGFPAEPAAAVLHIILSHHGRSSTARRSCRARARRRSCT